MEENSFLKINTPINNLNNKIFIKLMILLKIVINNYNLKRYPQEHAKYSRYRKYLTVRISMQMTRRLERGDSHYTNLGTQGSDLQFTLRHFLSRKVNLNKKMNKKNKKYFINNQKQKKVY